MKFILVDQLLLTMMIFLKVDGTWHPIEEPLHMHRTKKKQEFIGILIFLLGLLDSNSLNMKNIKKNFSSIFGKFGKFRREDEFLVGVVVAGGYDCR